MRRVDKNYDKFRRYEALLAGWWKHVMPTGTQRPAVVFICQDDEHRERFLAAADWQLSAHQTRWADLNPEREYPVRERFVFALERDIREGRAEGVRLPRQPPAVAKPRQPRARSPAPGRTQRVLSSTRVPPGMFPPLCSAVPFRPERNTRPDPPPPEILNPACAERGRGVRRFALAPPSSTCPGKRAGAAQAGAGRASAGRGEAGERRERGVGARSGEQRREGDGQR